MPRTVQQLFDLKGRAALITGGSRGLGLQMAQALGEAGARVVISSRKAEELEAATTQLQAQGIDAHWITADFQKEAEIHQLAQNSIKHLGHVDILINNAGASWGAPAEEHPVAGWDKVMNLNVRSYFILSQDIAKASMIPRKTGRIVNTSSIAGLGGNPPGMKTLAYNTSKGAVITFTQALACEWGAFGITVNTICPGVFPTKMAAPLMELLGPSYLDHVPLRRVGDEEDLKGLVVLLASDAGKHITGQWMAVDGGVSVASGG